MYLHELREQLSQGDIFTQIDLIDSANATGAPQQYNIVVLSHDCEIDKPSNSIVLACAIQPLTIFPPQQIGNLKLNRVRNAMYLESIGVLPESFVDFRCIFRVNKAFLEECSLRGLRIASLDDEARQGLLTYLYRFLARVIPKTRQHIIALAIYNCRVTCNNIVSSFLKSCNRVKQSLSRKNSS